jgi:hypothetical protein
MFYGAMPTLVVGMRIRPKSHNMPTQAWSMAPCQALGPAFQ